jgi:prepilin-type processing-associated H-X9-DG protein
VLILPFLEQEALYRQYRFDEPWNGPHNSALASQIPSVYRCPTEAPPEAPPGVSKTSYAMIVGPHAISDGPTPRKLGDVKDGLSNTIMVAECAGAGIQWLEPRDLNAEKITNDGIGTGEYKNPPGGINSFHPGMAHVLFCDGAVHTIHSSVDEKTLKALLTIDGGEAVEPQDF